jgi:hypothetical protein
MSVRLSRLLLAIEAVLLALPSSAVCLWLLFASGLTSSFGLVTALFPMALAAALGIAGLVAGWRLLIGFLFGGPERLGVLSSAWWLIAGMGAVVATLGVAAWFCRPSSTIPSYCALDIFRPFAAAAPAVIPLTHVALERWFRRSSNYRLERP